MRAGKSSRCVAHGLFIQRKRIVEHVAPNHRRHNPAAINPVTIDFEAMREAAARFAGTHDFASFAASTGSEEDDKERSTEREIFSTELVRSPENEELVFTVRGRSFLRYMVRKMVGTLLDVGRGRLKPDDIDRLFELRDRSKSGPTVPPQGLVMVEVQHEEAWRLGRP